MHIDITKPLLRGNLVNIKGNKVWLTFKYERIPDLFFRCGIIEHVESSFLKASLARSIHDRNQSQVHGFWH